MSSEHPLRSYTPRIPLAECEAQSIENTSQQTHYLGALPRQPLEVLQQAFQNIVAISGSAQDAVRMAYVMKRDHDMPVSTETMQILRQIVLQRGQAQDALEWLIHVDHHTTYSAEAFSQDDLVQKVLLRGSAPMLFRFALNGIGNASREMLQSIRAQMVKSIQAQQDAHRVNQEALRAFDQRYPRDRIASQDASAYTETRRKLVEGVSQSFVAAEQARDSLTRFDQRFARKLATPYRVQDHRGKTSDSATATAQKTADSITQLLNATTRFNPVELKLLARRITHENRVSPEILRIAQQLKTGVENYFATPRSSYETATVQSSLNHLQQAVQAVPETSNREGLAVLIQQMAVTPRCTAYTQGPSCT
ncbi:hypothetical protein [Acidithiobacillus thiooxidans]|uniref:hypothetical protein n=1 Tax=Acidithiobacillus thiooxidans TaxID=930 RepID=UPI0035699FCD|nr:hypothetical protein [Acidithiobacillus sp.]